MARNAFEQIKQIVKDQTNKTPGLVSNLHGEIAVVMPLGGKPSAHSWYVVQAARNRLPTLREFIDAYSYERTPPADVTGVGGTSVYPASGMLNPGMATLFLTTVNVTGPAVLPLSVSAPGHEIAVYVSDLLCVTALGTADVAVPLKEGRNYIAVIAFGGLSPVAITAPEDMALVKGEPAPPPPLLAGLPTFVLPNAADATPIVTLSWHNDPYASAWQVYRAESEEAGTILSYTPYGDTIGVARLATITSGFTIGDRFFTNSFYGGVIANLTLGADYTDVVIELDVDAPTDVARWTGTKFMGRAESFASVGNVTYAGQPVLRYEDVNVITGRLYIYRVTAFGFLSGAIESEYSEPGWVLTNSADTGLQPPFVHWMLGETSTGMEPRDGGIWAKVSFNSTLRAIRIHTETGPTSELPQPRQDANSLSIEIVRMPGTNTGAADASYIHFMAATSGWWKRAHFIGVGLNGATTRPVDRLARAESVNPHALVQATGFTVTRDIDNITLSWTAPSQPVVVDSDGLFTVQWFVQRDGLVIAEVAHVEGSTVPHTFVDEGIPPEHEPEYEVFPWCEGVSGLLSTSTVPPAPSDLRPRFTDSTPKFVTDATGTRTLVSYACDDTRAITIEVQRSILSGPGLMSRSWQTVLTSTDPALGTLIYDKDTAQTLRLVTKDALGRTLEISDERTTGATTPTTGTGGSGLPILDVPTVNSIEGTTSPKTNMAAVLITFTPTEGTTTEIQRAENLGEILSDPGEYAGVGAVGLGKTEFEDSPLTPGTYYWYRIRAVQSGYTPSPWVDANAVLSGQNGA
jgi:hypothetical protein